MGSADLYQVVCMIRYDTFVSRTQWRNKNQLLFETDFINQATADNSFFSISKMKNDTSKYHVSYQVSGTRYWIQQYWYPRQQSIAPSGTVTSGPVEFRRSHTSGRSRSTFFNTSTPRTYHDLQSELSTEKYMIYCS